MSASIDAEIDRRLRAVEELQAERARCSFPAYRRLMNPKLKWGWWAQEVSELLQQFYEDLHAGKRPKLVIQSPPQHGKSILIIDFIGWLAGKDPDLRTIYAAFSERLCVRANLRLQRMYDSEMYKSIFPETKINISNSVTISGQYLRNREIIEYVGREGFFRNTTVRGSVTGESLDLGVIDDPIKGRAEANSEVVRDAAWDWLTDDFFTRFSEHAGLLCILTRWHVDDPIGRLQEQLGSEIKVATYSAIADEDEPHRKKGEALFPEHKTLEFLMERKGIMLDRNWLALYQQKPTNATGNMFKVEKLGTVGAVPVGTKFVRGWDFGATDGGGDWTVGVKLGKMPDGRWVVADVVRGQLGPEDVETALKNTADADGQSVSIRGPQDPGQAGKAQAKRLAKILAGKSIKFLPVTGDKVLRAEPFAAQVNVGNVVLLSASWNDKYIDELRGFPDGTHDDQVDASSDAFDELEGGGHGIADYMKMEAEAVMGRADLPTSHSAAPIPSRGGSSFMRAVA